MDNNEIIQLFLKRDESAIVFTAEKFEKYCCKIAVNILGDQYDAEEAVNDVLNTLWNTIPPQIPRDLGAYAAMITHNVCIDRLRSRNAERRKASLVPLEELENLLCGKSDEIDESISLEELQNAINEFLKMCKERDRVIFVRRYYFCESVNDIANKYRMAPNYVTKLLTKMRMKLRVYLEKEGFNI